MDTTTRRPESLIGETARFSGSILVGLLAGLVLQVWTVAFLGRLGSDALFVRAIYAPVGFLVLAVTEGLVVTAQVAAGIATREGRRGAAVRPAATYLTVGGTLLAIIAAGSPWLLPIFEVPPALRPDVVAFVVAVCLSSVPGLVPQVGGALLRGVGRPAAASVLGAGFTVLSIAAMVVLQATTGWGVLSVPAGGLVAAVVAGPATVIAVRRAGLPVPRVGLRRDAVRQLWTFGAPVAATFLLLSTVTSGYLWVLRAAGTAGIAGFGLGQMATSFFLVVALAAGSGGAVAANLRPGRLRRPVNEAGMAAVLWVTVPTYVVISAAAHLLRGPLARVLTADHDIARVTADYFAWIGPTFALFGGSLALLTFLEQIGRARAAFLLNAVYFAVVLTTAVLLPQPVGSTTLAKLLAASNVVGFVTLYLSVRHLVRRPD